MAEAVHAICELTTFSGMAGKKALFIWLTRAQSGAFSVAGSFFTIDGHSEVHGPTKESPRVLIDLMVDDIDAEESRLRSAGVEFIRSKGEEYWGGIISTFKDPDGNYCQIMSMKSEGAQPA